MRWTAPRTRCLPIRHHFRAAPDIDSLAVFSGATPLVHCASDEAGIDMADTDKPTQGNRIERDSDNEQFTGTPAIRHVGRTLESDETYADTEQIAGGLTPEAQIGTIGAPPESTMGRGATDLSADVSSTDDAAKARIGRNAEPEALKTRLPGDTSSDPHTDLGPDNATTVQHRGEGQKRER